MIGSEIQIIGIILFSLLGLCKNKRSQVNIDSCDTQHRIERGKSMGTHSLKSDLRILELGSEHLPRFSKNTTADEVKNILDNLKTLVREQRNLLVMKYQDKMGANEEKIKEINEAAERIFEL